MNSIKSANQVLQRTSEYLSSGLVQNQPAWYKALAFNPPKHSFLKKVRPEILKQAKSEELSTINDINEKNLNGYYITRVKTAKKNQIKNLLNSQNLHFIEDDLRLLFYKQHPWELANPKNLVENEYNLGNKNCDWSNLRQFSKKLDGESVVQRTLYLMEIENKTLLDSYEQAKFEYYQLKIEDEAEMNIAREESEMFGAVYPKTVIEEGFEKESEVLAKWSSDAVEQTKILDAKFSNSGSSATSSADTTSQVNKQLTEEELLNL